MNPKALLKLLTKRCNRCSHQWLPRKIGKRPAQCPACRSPYWDQPRKYKIKSDARAAKRR